MTCHLKLLCTGGGGARAEAMHLIPVEAYEQVPPSVRFCEGTLTPVVRLATYSSKSDLPVGSLPLCLNSQRLTCGWVFLVVAPAIRALTLNTLSTFCLTTQTRAWRSSRAVCRTSTDEIGHVLQVRKLLFQNFPPCSGELCEGKKRGEKKGCRGRWNGPRIRCKCGVVTHKGCHRCKE